MRSQRRTLFSAAALLAVILFLGVGLGIARAEEDDRLWNTSAEPPEGTAAELLSPPDGLTIHVAHPEPAAPAINAILPGTAGFGLSSAVTAEGEATRLLSPADVSNVNPAYEEILPQYEPVQGAGGSAPAGEGG